MIETLVSVVVPVYNAENYLDSCIASVLSQTMKSFELLLVDDGSTDRSGGICDQYAAQDGRIRVIHQSNQGVAAARNAGLEKCLGKFIVFLDSDDAWDPAFLNEMISGMKDNDLAVCHILKRLPSGDLHEDPVYSCDLSQWCWPILNNYSISCWRCLFRRESIERCGITFSSNRRAGEDQEFTYKYMISSSKIAYASRAVYFYRVHSESSMHKANYLHFDAVEAMMDVERYAKEHLNSAQYEEISAALRGMKYPYLLEFAILNVITGGEKPDKVMAYLREHEYDELLNAALKMDKHWESEFTRRWERNPRCCLNYYYIRRKIGRIVRRLRG